MDRASKIKLTKLKNTSLALARRFVSAIQTFGFGRWDALSEAHERHSRFARTPFIRFVSLLMGALMIGIAVALLSSAALGMTPFDVLSSGISNSSALSLGQASTAASAVMLLTAAVLRRPPSLWAFAYIASAGFAVDYVDNWINTPDDIFTRWLFVFGALMFLSTGISLVVHSGRTGGSFGLLVSAAQDRGLSRPKARIILECSVLGSGVLLGGDIGPATLVIALALGPSLAAWGQVFDDWSTGRAKRLRRQAGAKNGDRR